MTKNKKRLKVCLVSGYSQVPPYGILSMASILEKNEINVKILDFTKFGAGEDVVLSGVRDSDIIGFSAWSMSMIIEVARMSRLIRDRFKDRKFIIWGGVHPSLFPKEVIEEFDLDAACVGEGEFAMLDLVNTLEAGGDLSDVKGLWLRRGSDVVFTGERKDLIDVEALPGYAWHLIDVDKYIINIKLTSTRELTLVESRGCPYQCGFCYAPKMFGLKWRGRTVDQIIEEIKFLRDKYDIRRFDLLDDLPFGGDRRKMMDFCGKIKKLRVEWSCDQRINHVDEELLVAMKESGIWYIYFGVESGSTRMLKKMKKTGVTPEKIVEVFDLCFKIGIVTMAGFIVGIPGETKEDLDDSVRLAKRIRATLIRVASYIPYAGTELYKEALNRGFTPPVSAEDWGRLGIFEYVSVSLAEVPRHELKRIQRKMQLLSYWKSILFSVHHMKFNLLPYLILYTAVHINPDSKTIPIIIKLLRPFIWTYSKIHRLAREAKDKKGEAA